MVQLLIVTCMLLVLSDKGKGKQNSSEQPLVGEDHCVTTLIAAAKETRNQMDKKTLLQFFLLKLSRNVAPFFSAFAKQ